MLGPCATFEYEFNPHSSERTRGEATLLLTLRFRFHTVLAGKKMRTTLVVLGLAGFVLAQPVAAQQARFHIGAHLGTLDDGRGLLGGQIGVNFGKSWVGYAGGTRVGGVGAGASLSLWEAGVRWVPPSGRRLRPYVLVAVAVERARFNDEVTNLSRDDRGFVFGGGLEIGKGKIQPFVEARGFKDGSVAGFFWVGLRVKAGH